MTRRDKCHLIGKRAWKLDMYQAACAWRDLSAQLQDMGIMDVPKFRDLLKAIRIATINGRKANWIQ